jgi:hypothetical protein
VYSLGVVAGGDDALGGGGALREASALDRGGH